MKRRWRKLNAADALSGSIIAMLVVWALLSRCGMDEAAYENFTAGSLTNIMYVHCNRTLVTMTHQYDSSR